MRITVDNIRSVLGARPEQLPLVLPLLFAKLLQPNQDEFFLQNYCGAIKQGFARDERPNGQLGFDSFAEASIEAGIVPTMLQVTQNNRPESTCGIAGYQALDALMHLMRIGNLIERRALLNQLMANNVLDICLEKAENHHLCIHRHLGVSALRVLASESFLGQVVSASQASNIIVKMCEFVLQGPNVFVDQMCAPATTWQSCMFMGSQGVPAEKAARYVYRYYAMGQESAIWAVHGLLCTSPPSTRKFCLEILQHNPQILDLLFACALVPRPAWYPETQVDSVACEILVLLFQFPLEVVPGVSVPLEGDLKAEMDSEWTAMVESLRILTSRKNWVEKILSAWKKIEDEKWQSVKPLFNRVKADYFAQEPPDEESFCRLFEYRGTSRICMLRIIATVTHAAKDCNISDADLVSLLPLCYSASQPWKGESNISDPSQLFSRIQRTQELHRSPLWTVNSLEMVDPPELVAEEAVMGPTALVRLLCILAERGTLDAVQKWKRLPRGTTSHITLRQVQQICTQQGLRRLLDMACERVTVRRKKGHECLQLRDEDFARVSYSTAAELAAALVALHRDAPATQLTLRTPGAFKELVLCMGNAAEMALRLKQYRKAFWFALGAVKAAEDLAIDEVEDPASFVAKNMRRLELAKAGVARSMAGAVVKT